MLIRVPEAYALLKPFDATRPGLLVLDADGRRVASIPLPGRSASDVARELTAARTRTPTERILLRSDDPLEALAKRVDAIDGVGSVEVLPGHLQVRADAGVLSPAVIDRLLAETETTAVLLDPVPVVVKTDARHPIGALGRVPGVWYSGRSTRTNAWITRWLAHPDLLTKVGLGSNLVARRFELDDVPKGGLAAALLRAPFSEPGVIDVISHVFDDAVEVVGRSGEIDFDSVGTALEAKLAELAEGPPAGGG